MLTSETKTFAIFSGVICGLAFLALGSIVYLIQTQDAAYADRLQVRATRIATDKQAESFNKLVAETASDRTELTQYILTEDSVVGFLSRIGNLAHARGLTAETRSLAVKPIEGNTVFEYLTLEVDVTGPFEPVTQMLSVLEALPYQVQVRTVSVERASETKGGMLWHGSYHLSVTKYK